MKIHLTFPARHPIISGYSKIKMMPSETNEFLTRCVVDTLARKFYLYSSEGGEKVVECETVDQFMNVLDVVRSQLDEETLVYSNPF
jgi:hypothetical protein